MDMNLTVSRISLSGRSNRTVEVDLDGVDKSEVMSQLTVSDILEHFDADDLLSEIGEDAARKYFGIEEADHVGH